VTPREALLAFALVGVPAGLVAGLALGLVARRDDGWGGYASFRRRAARLGHVALVMLPALGGLYALLLEGAPEATAWFPPAAVAWMSGGVALVAALFLAAWRPALRALLPLPALALCAAAALFACAWCAGR
jgi:hypothetical protein